MSKIKVLQVLADDAWFEGLEPKQQKEYIEEHPNSKYAKKVLDKGAETVKKGGVALKNVAKNYTEEQKKFFSGEDSKPGSKVRRSFGTFMSDKAKGLVKGLKAEVHEFKEAGEGLYNLAKGQKITHHQKTALKTILLHTAMVVGPMAISGGLSAGITHMLPSIATHFLEHSLMITAGKVALFAAPEGETKGNEEAYDDLVEHLITKFSEYVADNDFSEEDWAAIVSGSKEGPIDSDEDAGHPITPEDKHAVIEDDTEEAGFRTILRLN